MVETIYMSTCVCVSSCVYMHVFVCVHVNIYLNVCDFDAYMFGYLGVKKLHMHVLMFMYVCLKCVKSSVSNVCEILG